MRGCNALASYFFFSDDGDDSDYDERLSLFGELLFFCDNGDGDSDDSDYGDGERLSVGCPKKTKSPNFVSQLTPVVFIG